MTLAATRKRPLAGYFNIVGAIVALLIIVPLALRASSTEPPAVAEFAPQPRQQIHQAPGEQAGLFGNEGGPGGLFSSASPSPLASLAPGVLPSPSPTINPARVRKCIGDPPRQIEDPQSPPCVPYFDGPNGDSTYAGVTRDTITVALPYQGAAGTDDRALDLLQNFFNDRFEFYGRKIKFVKYTSCNGREDSGPANTVCMKADAQMVAKQMGAFASLGYDSDAGTEQAYYDELARLRLISVSSRTVWRSETDYQAKAPYEWSYPAGGQDTGQRLLGGWICAQLNGKPASHAGPVLALSTRKFGILVQDEPYGPDDSALIALLQGCTGGPIPVAKVAEYDSTSEAGAALTMQSDKVTTIICLCHQGTPVGVSEAGDQQGYLPEYILSSYIQGDEDLTGQLMSAGNGTSLFGLTYWNKNMPLLQLPINWAVKQEDPTYSWPTPIVPYYGTRYYYPGMLLLAAGIQMAGPNLTPATFQTGLQRAIFPNPGARVAPYYQGEVGFQGKHTMINDAAAIWFSANDQSDWDASAGTWCYADLGLRFGLDHIPGTSGIYQEPCR